MNKPRKPHRFAGRKARLAFALRLTICSRPALEEACCVYVLGAGFNCPFPSSFSKKEKFLEKVAGMVKNSLEKVVAVAKKSLEKV